MAEMLPRIIGLIRPLGAEAHYLIVDDRDLDCARWATLPQLTRALITLARPFKAGDRIGNGW